MTRLTPQPTSRSGRTLAVIASAILICIAPPPVTATGAAPPAAAVATAHPLATDAGREILAAGGNAFDAAVAVTAALAVVEPMSSGLGGGGFWLLHDADGNRNTMIDGRERAPLAARRDMYLDKQGHVIPKLSIDGPLAAGIPGVPAAMVYLAKHYGRLPLSRSLAPAIHYAREGFTVDDRYRALARFRLAVLRRSAAASAVFLVENDVPPPGTVIKQPDLAAALDAIAQDGDQGFYTGTVAQRLVNGVQKAGGIWRLADLSEYRVVERAPVEGSYRGTRIIAAAPPSSGGVALITMLNILSGYDLDRLDDVTRKHLIIEAMRRAYRDRAEYLGDPDFVTVPVKRLIHPYYAAGLRNSIRLDRATPSASLPGFTEHTDGTNTTHFSVLDQQGNRVAATLSINYPFGSGFVAPGTGVLLNDEMDDFSAKPGTPNVYGLVGAEANAIAPGKRPLSSMTPTFLEGNHGVAVLGTPGGSRIITMVLLAVLDYMQGHDPASWVALPRYHHQYLPDTVEFEPGALDKREQQRLAAMGHVLDPLRRRYGNMQAILWQIDHNKVLAASDPRGYGKAVVFDVTKAMTARH
jgi:gamma-glutamyltranspeptidase/glutathione hydrolase